MSEDEIEPQDTAPAMAHAYVDSLHMTLSRIRVLLARIENEPGQQVPEDIAFSLQSLDWELGNVLDQMAELTEEQCPEEATLHEQAREICDTAVVV